MLDVRVLGGLSAAVDGRPVELPADARARELLARLALSPGSHPRSALAGRLRPDVADDSARKTLRNALYELRRALGPAGGDALDVTAERVGLRASGVRVDLWEFRRRLADGELEAAVQAGQGELLDGFDGEWALRARAEHAAELAGALATLAARAEEAGDGSGAVAWARRRLGVEPLAEAAHRELIRLLAADGDRASALAAAGALSERLRSELGVVPSAQTRALVEDVRRGRIGGGGVRAASSAPPLPDALAVVERPEGREPALARLERAWAEARSGARRFAVVSGEPGIGKTTLAGELARRAHAEGAAVLLGRSDELALVPFRPWVQALEQLLQALPAAEADHWLTEHDGALARLLPARSAAGVPISGDRERYLAFELVLALLDDTAARWPVLLVLDDLHWADADSLSLLRHLVSSGRAARMLVVVCARAAELDAAAGQAIAEMQRAGPVVRVELAGLDEHAVAALLQRRTGTSDDAAARRYRARSGGNPFFLDELLREAREAGGELDRPPAGVRDVIARRLARLGDPTLRALDVAAVCGLEFEATMLARADGSAVADVLEALDGAIDAGLVVATSERGTYAFAHALVAETIAAGLPGSRRARLHARLADVSAEGHAAGAVGAGEVVRHLRGAGALVDARRLASWELTAAEQATAALAHADAAAHYEAALAAGAGEREHERGGVLLALGHAQDRAARRERARAAFAGAAAIARRSRDPLLLARAALGNGGTAVVIAAPDAGVVELLEEALAAAPPGAHGMSARLLARLAVELYYADPARSRELSAAAVDRARRAEDPAALAAALNARRVALWSPHHIEERLVLAGDMLRAAQAAGDREAVLQARNWRVVDLLESGRLEEATAEIGAYESLADAVSLPHFRWYVPLWRATLAILGGRWNAARELGDAALALGRQAEDPNAPLFVEIQVHHALFAQRRIGEMGRTRLVEGAARSPASAEWLVNLALVDAETGRTDAARRLVAELARDNCSALAMDANWHGACMLADAAVLVGDQDAGAALHALLEPHAGLFPVVARAVACLGSAEYYLGRLAGLLGRHDEAEARLRRSVIDNDRAGAKPQSVMALLRLGECLTARRNPDAARDVLRQAAERAGALDMPPVVAGARRLLEGAAV